MSKQTAAAAAQHTPGPWHVYGASVYDAGPASVATCNGKYRSLSEREANAARIVACVNYCDGIDAAILNGPEKLADFRAYVEALLDSCHTLRAQRDELAAAARRAEDFIKGFEGVDCEETAAVVNSILAELRAALAKVQP